MTGAELVLLTAAVCMVESSGQTHAINAKDGHTASYGECQVKLATARHLGYTGSVGQLWLDQDTNRYWAQEYLSYQLRRYRGNVRKAVSAYNCGSACNNTAYVEKVLKFYRRFQRDNQNSGQLQVGANSGRAGN